MKRIILTLACFMSTVHGITQLPPAPTTFERYQEIVVRYDNTIADSYNALTPEERVFLYYLYRASLPGNRILSDQLHENANALIDTFYALATSRDTILSLNLPDIDLPTFVKQAECYFVYVWSNHSQYFEREFENNKRTPAKLGLNLLTPENISKVLAALNIRSASLQDQLFDQHYQPTLTVPGNIEKSAINIYSHGFTEADYQTLSAEERGKINNYFYIETVNGNRIAKAQPYCINGRYGTELSVSCYWLAKAQAHAQKYPALFDAHLVKSIELLIAFFQTGDEELFKQHSIEWLQTASRISYCLGFVEVYRDPKGVRGFFQGDATIKCTDLTPINTILPQLEQQLPLPAEFKRELSDKFPNACVGCKVFGTGDAGPLRITSAYCLPNYSEIRSNCGSKQIMYTSTKSLSVTLNPAGYRNLFFAKPRALWFAAHDPECSIHDDMWDIHVILHETIGHGSGKLATHTFKEGDNFTIDGKTYAVGDTIPVTSSNEAEFLAGYVSAIEELRAEIIALYVLLTSMDVIVERGFLTKWARIMTRDELIDWAIHAMLHDCLKRLVGLADNATAVTGDHARADWTIFMYLLDRGCFKIAEENVLFDKKLKTVLAITAIDTPKTIAAVTELMQEVQRIKSTGDGLAARKLVGGYCEPLSKQSYIAILNGHIRALIGDLKVSAMLPPLFTPQCDTMGEITDIQATWPANVIELARYERERELSAN